MTVPLFVLLMCSVLRAQTDDVAHFEKRVRPVLLKNCVPCHGPKKQESGFRLDTRRGVLAGGEISGPSVDLKAPQTSVLLKAIRHEGDISMPPEKKLLDAEILAMETWVKAGLLGRTNRQPLGISTSVRLGRVTGQLSQSFYRRCPRW